MNEKPKSPFDNLECYPDLHFQCVTELSRGRRFYKVVVFLGMGGGKVRWHYEVHRFFRAWRRISKGEARTCEDAQRAGEKALIEQLTMLQRQKLLPPDTFKWRCH